tara:strand:- start:4413 stop:4574 length:162 start_codon:yes stop_codon:yes gene_type:complete
MVARAMLSALGMAKEKSVCSLQLRTVLSQHKRVRNIVYVMDVMLYRKEIIENA